MISDKLKGLLLKSFSLLAAFCWLSALCVHGYSKSTTTAVCSMLGHQCHSDTMRYHGDCTYVSEGVFERQRKCILGMGVGYYRTRNHQSFKVPVEEEGATIQSWLTCRPFGKDCLVHQTTL